MCTAGMGSDCLPGSSKERHCRAHPLGWAETRAGTIASGYTEPWRTAPVDTLPVPAGGAPTGRRESGSGAGRLGRPEGGRASRCQPVPAAGLSRRRTGRPARVPGTPAVSGRTLYQCQPEGHRQAGGRAGAGPAGRAGQRAGVRHGVSRCRRAASGPGVLVQFATRLGEPVRCRCVADSAVCSPSPAARSGPYNKGTCSRTSRPWPRQQL